MKLFFRQNVKLVVCLSVLFWNIIWVRLQCFRLDLRSCFLGEFRLVVIVLQLELDVMRAAQVLWLLDIVDRRHLVFLNDSTVYSLHFRQLMSREATPSSYRIVWLSRISCILALPLNIFGNHLLLRLVIAWVEHLVLTALWGIQLALLICFAHDIMLIHGGFEFQASAQRLGTNLVVWWLRGGQRGFGGDQGRRLLSVRCAFVRRINADLLLRNLALPCQTCLAVEVFGRPHRLTVSHHLGCLLLRFVCRNCL